MDPNDMEEVDIEGRWELENVDIETINCLVVYY